MSSISKNKMERVIILQKFLITNGKRFIRKVKSNTYTYCNSPTAATLFNLREAEHVLCKQLEEYLRKEYWIEGESDFLKITYEEIVQSQKKPDVEHNFDNIFSIVNSIVKSITELSIPDKKILLIYKKQLEDILSTKDKELSDIDHWVMDHKPPAHVRTKVYGIQHDIENDRRKIKESYRYVTTLIDSLDRNYTYAQMKHELKKMLPQPYKPSTDLYGQLDALT